MTVDCPFDQSPEDVDRRGEMKTQKNICGCRCGLSETMSAMLPEMTMILSNKCTL
jgi:hypothetical protein